MPANKLLFITRPQLVSPAYLRAASSKTQDAPGEDSKDNLQSQIHPESRSPSESLLNLDTPPDFSSLHRSQKLIYTFCSLLNFLEHY